MYIYYIDIGSLGSYKQWRHATNLEMYNESIYHKICCVITSIRL